MAEIEMQMEKPTKKPTMVPQIILYVVLAAIVFGAGGYYLGTKQPKATNTVTASVTPIPVVSKTTTAVASTTATTIATATTKTDLKTYSNSKFKFTFQIPSNYSVLEEYQAEGAEGVTVRFGKETSEGISEYNFLQLNYNKAGYDFAALEKSALNSIGSDLGETSQLTIDGQKAEKFEVGGFASGYKVISAKGDGNLTIDLYPNNDENTAFMNQVISTFKYPV